ncbi:MAG: metallophosphoesterase family protein [Vulcanimicrobiaceae bacterium]
MPLRIVHCADLHLETVFADRRGGARRRAALADALVRIVELALARRADVLTIGGDLYEGERTGPQTIRFLFEQFARFGRPIYLAPGNHDPFSLGSPLARADLPPNVRLFDEAAWRAYPLASNVTLYGFGHTPAEPGRPFANARFERAGLKLALVHGSDEARCPPHKRATAPLLAEEVRAAGAELALLGHYHGGYVAERDGRAVLAYPGSAEPIRFGEGDAHGALLVTIDGGALSLEAIPLARTRALDLRCDLEGAPSEHAVLERLEATLAGCGRDDYVRVELVGAPERGTRLDLETARRRYEDALGSLELSDATTAFDAERIAHEPTVRGHVARELRALAGDPDPRQAARGSAALRLALAAFDGVEIAP